MDNYILYGDLFLLYRKLLTEKEEERFCDYYLNDLSFSEMSVKYKVSKAYLQKEVKRVEKKLNSYEEKLHLKKYQDYLEMNNQDVLKKLRSIDV